jgi:hypothetical protein
MSKEPMQFEGIGEYALVGVTGFEPVTTGLSKPSLSCLDCWL